MKDIVIVGSGALGQELCWLIEEINDLKPTWNILGFLDDFGFDNNSTFIGYRCIGKIEDAKKYSESYFTIAFGDPRFREDIYNKLKVNINKWATLISPSVRIHSSNKIGKGVVIGRNTDLTVNCIINDFSFLNIHVVLGHEVEIGEFTIISPNVTVNGGGKIERCCQIGANSFIKDVCIGEYSTIGASSCVVKNVESFSVMAGVPAKILKKGLPNKSISRDAR